MRGKLKTVGKGYQPAEVLLVEKRGGVLRIDDCGGWAQRNESMARLFRAADATSGTGDALADFAPLLVQTTDRCFAQRRAATTWSATCRITQSTKSSRWRKRRSRRSRRRKSRR